MKLKFRPTIAYTKETGLVLVLIFLLTAYWKEDFSFILISIMTLVVVMTIPVVLKPLAVAWYYFSIALGNITNRIILTVIFALVLAPVGMMRRSLGFDPMKRKTWKNGKDSVFKTRDHVFTSDDLNTPY
jgi:hypothetical protein